MDFDIADYEDVTQADITIKDPATGAPTAITFTLAGPEHPKRKKIDMDRQRRMRAQLQKTGKLQFQDPEEDEQDETDSLVACTLGWTGLTLNGHPLVFSADNARQIYTDPKRRWLRAQVVAALAEREAFIKRSATA